MRRDRDDELAREIRTHLEAEAEDRMADGLSERDARYAARRAFGNVTRTREDARAVWTRRWLDDLVGDVRYALRTFTRAPTFTAAAVLTLALGIGANTAIFSVVNAVLLRPLPYPDSGRLVRIMEDLPPGPGAPAGGAGAAPMNEDEFLWWRGETETLSHLVAHAGAPATYAGPAGAVALSGARISPAAFEMLGVAPLLGRSLEAADERADAAVVVLSESIWRRDFGGDDAVAGRVVSFDGQAYTVVGVMPARFDFPAGTDFWRPFVMQPSPFRETRFNVVARMRDGVSFEEATAEANVIGRALRGPSPPGASADRFRVVSMQDELVAPVRPALQVLTVAVGVVLLIACVNVASLVLGRAAARARETAVRAALGARPGRLVRQAVTESLVLSLAGGVAGVALAAGGIRLLGLLGATLGRRDLGSGTGLPRLDLVGLDAPVLGFALALSVLTGLAFAMAPALRLRARARGPSLQGAATQPVGAGAVPRVGGLVVVQIALAVALLVGGGLLMRSFVALATLDPGYDASNMLTFQVILPPDRYTPSQARAFAVSLANGIRGTADIRAVGYAADMPMVQVRRRIPPPRDEAQASELGAFGSGLLASMVSANYFDVLDIEIIAGRGFTDDDRAGGRQVVVINQAMAAEVYPGVDPVGRRFYSLGSDPWTIVGVAADARQRTLARAAEPQAFFDLRQVDGDRDVPGYFFVRTADDPLAVLPVADTVVQRLDPGATVTNVATLDHVVSDSIATPRMYAVLMAAFAAVAVGLSVVGLYGLLAYTVIQRTREIGIRMALGARRSEVLALVLRQSVVLTSVGIALGLGGALGLTRYLEGMLFGLAPLDPVTFVSVSILFAVVASVATLIPARQATRVDPMVALRCE